MWRALGFKENNNQFFDKINDGKKCGKRYVNAVCCRQASERNEDM
jgi:hypothetical protein